MNNPLSEELNAALKKIYPSFSRRQLLSGYQELSMRYRNPNRDKENIFITSDAHRLAYLAVRMPATYAVVTRVLCEIKNRLPDFTPKLLCDLGAGPGTATWAAIATFEITDATLYEKDKQWLELGKQLMSEALSPALTKAKWVQDDLLQVNDFGMHDLIIMSYVIGELPLEKVSSLLLRSWLATSKLLVIIEPGTPHGFERIRFARDWLIQNQAHLVAPCPHHANCPMSKGDWCHFSERLERSRLHMDLKEGSLGYEDEKFSYIIASKAHAVGCKRRILEPPKHHSGHIEFKLCESEGIMRRTLSRKHREAYKQARRLNWGDSLDHFPHQ